MESTIDNLDSKVKNTYDKFSSRNSSLKQEITKVNEEISLQDKAYNRYIKQANSVGLSSEWVKKIKNGTIDISTITDDGLIEKIQEYQKWYEKAIACKEAIDDLEESVSSLYKTAFSNVVSQYDGILATIEHKQNMLEELISQSEEKGFIVSSKYYDALITTEKDNISQLEKEKASLITALNNSVNSGAIKKNSEAWYDMCNQIDDVTLAIEQANTAIIEYQNSIRDIKWEVFDLLQEKISNIINESDFLIDLMSNENLFNDKGHISDEGKATIGLHGMNYNAYMAQSDKYAKEIIELDREIAKNPYDQELINRRQELLELQQESILSAEDEKQAIISMIQDGIDLELDSLKNLIDTYTEALDAQKDLYDYQKKVKDQTKEISNLQKELSAYENDNSEEARAKIQQIKVSLEEAKQNLQDTEYDKYVTSQKELLDSLYDEYELILNARLDNVDALISDVINEINYDAESIKSTIIDQANSVGYQLSDSMTSIWNTSTGDITKVITEYGTGFNNAATTVNTTLGTINTNIQNIITALNKIANTNISSEKVSSSANPPKNNGNTNANTNPPTGNSNNSNSKPQTSNNSKNFFITKKDSYPKDKLNITESIVDRLKWFNYDSSFAMRAMYYSKMGFGGTYTGSYAQNVNMLNWMKKNGYKNGTVSASHGLHLYDEDGLGSEAFITKYGVLKQFEGGEHVFDSESIKNLHWMATNPDLILTNKSISELGRINNINEGNVENNIDLDINITGVNDYETFVKKLQRDEKFEKMVKAMTLGQMMGKSKLDKYKQLWK